MGIAFPPPALYPTAILARRVEGNDRATSFSQTFAIAVDRPGEQIATGIDVACDESVGARDEEVWSRPEKRQQIVERKLSIAVYAGTFDPLHLGHRDVAQRAARLFDRLIFAVFTGTGSKKPVFTGAERVELREERPRRYP